METNKKRKYEGKAKHISEKYRFLRFENYSKEEFMPLLKELVSELKRKEKAIDSFELELAKKHKEIEHLKKKLSVFDNQTDSLEKYVGYDPDWLYVDKICFVIERTKKPLNSHQIVDLLIKIEPSLKLRLLDPFNSITKSIYNAVKLNRLLKYQKTGNYGFTYILPMWVNNEVGLNIR